MTDHIIEARTGITIPAGSLPSENLATIRKWRRRFPMLEWRLAPWSKPGKPLDLFALKRAQDQVKRDSEMRSFYSDG